MADRVVAAAASTGPWPSGVRFVLAAALVEAAAGCAAAACLVRTGRVLGVGALISGMFAAAALAASLVDVVLMPGWVWRQGRLEIVPVLARLGIAAAALPLAMFAGAIGSVVLVGSVGAVLPLAPVGSGPSDWIGPSLLFASIFGFAGATVGLGAAVAQAADSRSGAHPFPRARTRTHVAGVVAGLFLILAILAAAAAVAVWLPVPPWSPLVVLPPTLVIGGLPHNVLVLRDAVRGGDGLPDPKAALARAGMCALVLVLAGVGLLVTAL